MSVISSIKKELNGGKRLENWRGRQLQWREVKLVTVVKPKAK
jgi:hypothetical protein